MMWRKSIYFVNKKSALNLGEYFNVSLLNGFRSWNAILEGLQIIQPENVFHLSIGHHLGDLGIHASQREPELENRVNVLTNSTSNPIMFRFLRLL